MFIYFFVFFLGTELISVIPNPTNPFVTINPQESSNSFYVSIKSISELESNSGTVVNSLELSNISFSMVETSEGQNKMYNYSAIAENNADINVIVSFLQKLYIFKIIFD